MFKMNSRGDVQDTQPWGYQGIKVRPENLPPNGGKFHNDENTALGRGYVPDTSSETDSQSVRGDPLSDCEVG